MEQSAAIEEVVRSLYDDVWTARRYEVAEDLFHPDFSYAPVPHLRGAQAKLAAIRAYHQSCSDLRATVDDLVVTGDRAVARYTISGTDTGGFRGRPPTNRTFSTWGVDMFSFLDGRIITDWVGVDWLGLMVQTGVIGDPWAP